MRKEELLRCIAETGYNVGFGAKKHFATYDIVDKVPGVIGFASIAVGVFALFVDFLATKHLSAAFIILGVAGICISSYDHKKNQYSEAGKELTELFNRLKTLYFKAKSCSEEEREAIIGELSDIENQYIAKSLDDQIIFSDWYAHYKFFWQQQIDWIDEQKHFRFFRDKIPLSFMLGFVLLIVLSGIAVFL